MKNVKIIEIIKIGDHIIRPNIRCLIELCNKIELIGTFDCLKARENFGLSVWFEYGKGGNDFFEIDDGVAKLITKIESLED